MGRVVHRLKAHVVMLLFWSAILLPVAYPWVLITQVRSGEKLVPFVVLVGLHLVTLVGGHTYHRPVDS